MKLVLTCEHGGYEIPENYRSLFSNEQVLKTHRGYDIGALDVFNSLKPLSDASFSSTTSRLFIELNRSLGHRQLFSEFTRDLSDKHKTEIINDYYKPYRSNVENSIATFIKNKYAVLHLSIHSFTPQLNDEIRNCDIGLLYDSTDKKEKTFCKQLKTELLKLNIQLNVRFNYPYLGKSDGFTTHLRKQFSSKYLGIEIEINQNLTSKAVMNVEIRETIYKAIQILQSKHVNDEAFNTPKTSTS
jgi:predicted N-formylglutamate amidohydrolase